MAFIHGGAFMFGSSGVEFYGPDYFMQKDVLLFTFNYRLGVFGFLNLPDSTLNVPGNAGLKDQCLALKWIKNNAQNFGGDPNNITIFGESAGSCSVHLHLLSDMSKGLFNKAIMMSGSAFNHWSIVAPGDLSERLATKLGWNGVGGVQNMFKFLQTADAAEITTAQSSVLTDLEIRQHIFFPFGPSVESFVSEQSFMPESPRLMARWAWGNSVPLLLGGTSEEGLYLYRPSMDNPQLLKDADDNSELLVPIELGLDVDSDERRELGKLMKKYYFGSEQPSLKTLDKYVHLMTDKWFFHGIHRALLSRLRYAPAEAGPVFLYRFNYDSETFNHFRVNICGNGVRGNHF